MKRKEKKRKEKGGYIYRRKERKSSRGYGNGEMMGRENFWGVDCKKMKFLKINSLTGDLIYIYM